MQEVIHLNSSEAYFIYVIVCISAPTLGVLTGGFLIQYLGGYTTEKALDAICKLTFISFICSSFLPIFELPIFFAIFIWLLLFFESSVTPGLIGLMISSISGNYKELGNSITQLFYNLIGFLPSPFIYGLVSSYTGGEDSKWGLSVIILWSFFGFVSVVFAKKIIVNNEINEMNIDKEDYLENIIDEKNNDNNEFNSNEDGNERLQYKKSKTISGNFSPKDDKEIDNNKQNLLLKKTTIVSPNILKNSIRELKRKSTIITNLYGGINHL